MILDKIFKKKRMSGQQLAVWLNGDDDCAAGYTRLDQNPEVVGACFRIAQLISSMTIYLMANSEKGDIRIVNELSRKFDIEPCSNMTRSTWMQGIVMTLLLYGSGNAVVIPHTENGYLGDLEPVAADRVSFLADAMNRNRYQITIDGRNYDPAELVHVVFNPSETYLWKGQGFTVSLKGVVDTIAQAQRTKNKFMKSKYAPNLIVKVDALTDEFSGPEGRKKLLEDYFGNSEVGQPWMIPANEFDVKEVRPLSLSDLAINDAVVIDKKTVAGLLGVPAFLLGVGDYKEDEWNAFVSNTVRPIAQSIEQELTKKLLLSNKMYLMFNMSKLYSYNLEKTANVYSGLYTKGVVTGNEVRDKIGMQPRDGLDELIILENYIPVAKIGDQLKLKQEGE